jgi:uncharacterized protein YndB with AHSA1/START domain
MAGYSVEVEAGAGPEQVWSALTDPARISQWFGWDAETLDDEIRFIFVDHARKDERARRIEFTGEHGEGQILSVAATADGSVVRLSSRTGGRSAAESHGGTEVADPVEEGWIAFLYQLRRFVDTHPSGRRRTLRLLGTGPVDEVAAAVDLRLPGAVWFSGPFTRVYGTGDFGPGIGVLTSSAPLDSDGAGQVSLTLSTWGMTGGDFFGLVSDWLGWWRTLVDGGEASVFPEAGT